MKGERYRTMNAKLEYRSVIVGNHSNPTRRLNELGQDGWDAYTAIVYRDDSIVHFLKRPVCPEVTLEDLSAWIAALDASAGDGGEEDSDE